MKNGAQKQIRLLNSRDASKYLAVSVPVFYDLVKQGIIHQVSVGIKSKRYDLLDLDNFIMKNKKSIKA